MRRYISLLLFIGLAFWSCEEEQEDDALELVYSSINDGEVVESPSGIILKFSKEISDEIFDAVSIENYGDLGIQVPDTIDIDDNLQSLDLVDYIFLINHSNFIKLNNQPQSFLYDSNTKFCLLVGFNTELFPDGTGEGFAPIVGDNKLEIGDNEINFSFYSNSSVRVVPNPYVPHSGFLEPEPIRRIRFSNLPEIAIIDIYQLDNEQHKRRLIQSNGYSANLWWDLRDFSNQEISSGFYFYRLGADTTDTGYLNYLTSGYLGIITTVI